MGKQLFSHDQKPETIEPRAVAHVSWSWMGFGTRGWHLVVTATCLVCYASSLDCGLVHDDIFAIKDNQDLRPNTPISSLFANDFWGRRLTDDLSHKSYRPLCVLTFRLNYLIHGLDAFGFHLVNVVLHVAVANLFLYLCQSIIVQDLQTSVMAALLFAVHPVHVEAVTGVVGRADVLACLLFLSSFLSYARCFTGSSAIEESVVSWRLFWSLVMGAAAMFAKEHGATVFAACVAYDFISHRGIIFSIVGLGSRQSNLSSRMTDVRVKAKQLFQRTFILFLAAGGLFALRINLMGSSLPPFKHEDNPASFSSSRLTRVLTFSYLYSFNARLLLAPIVLCYDWQVGSIPLVESISDFRNLESLAFYAVMAALVLSPLLRVGQNNAYDQKVVWSGVALLVVPFLPASNLFLRVGFVIAERILYISSLGFCLLVAFGLRKLQLHMGGCYSTKRGILNVVFLLLLAIFAMKTASYNRVWKTRESLFRSGVESLPHNAKAHYNYGNYLKDIGDSDRAIQHYEEAVKLYPIHSSAQNNLATLLMERNPEAAEMHLKMAIEHSPGHYRAMVNLASIYRARKQLELAESTLNKALELKHDYYEGRVLLASVLADLKKTKESDRTYRALLKDRPDDVDVKLQHASMLSNAKLDTKAIRIYESILKTDPRHATAMNGLGKSYKNVGRYSDSLAQYLRAMELEPKNAVHYQGLAFLYWVQEQKQKAADVYERMMADTAPDREYVRNYAIVLGALNRRDEAIKLVQNLTTQYPDFPMAHYTLVNFLIEQGSTAQAHRSIDVGLQNLPFDPHLLVQRATLLREEKKYGDAEQTYFSVLAKNPDHAEAEIGLGSLYHLQGDLVKARAHYERAMKLTPGDPTLTENVRKLERLEKRQAGAAAA